MKHDGANLKKGDMLADALRRKAQRERQARQNAEKLLEDKSLELFNVNQALVAAQVKLEQNILDIENERDRVIRLSKLDSLTQLPNRRAILERLEQELTRQHHVAPDSGQQIWLVLILLKKFKRINALLGQVGGDQLLKVVAERIQSSIQDVCGAPARFSGTEFALVLSCDDDQLTG